MNTKPRVLVVDDEQDVLELANHHLEREGFEVIRAANGLEALNRARCDTPDVIVLDIMLPDLDGYCVGEILRVQRSTRDIPIIVFSALDPPLVKPRAPKLPYFGWIKKGEDIRCLSCCVRDALGAGLVRRRVSATAARAKAGPSAS